MWFGVYINFNDSSDHLKHRKVKQALKKLSKFETVIYTNDDYSVEELNVVREVGAVVMQSISKGETMPSIIDGASIPAARREEFIVAVGELASKNHINLPLHFQWLDGVVYTRPTPKPARRQRTNKKHSNLYLITFELVVRFGGSMSANSGEGRLRANAAYAQLDDDELDVYSQIKTTFDPFSILNPGVKQKSDLKNHGFLRLIQIMVWAILHNTPL